MMSPSGGQKNRLLAQRTASRRRPIQKHSFGLGHWRGNSQRDWRLGEIHEWALRLRHDFFGSKVHLQRNLILA